MTISYNWLCEYLPEKIDPERLSIILTSVGLEVESLEKYEATKGSLAGLIVGEVLSCQKHPNADKLKLTQVNIGEQLPLQIVCGAPNVAVNQKVIVAKPGVKIFPIGQDPITMKVAKIRGIESFGMICAEDEIGLGTNHAGILILPEDLPVGLEVSTFFMPYQDHVFQIGLTPNHMDAMSHIGVARDVCAYLSHHEDKEFRPKYPYPAQLEITDNSIPVTVTIVNETACPRYSGISIKNIIIKESPRWMQERLGALGVRPINNIVDITNYVLHETGQPLHAFDADEIAGKKVIVKNLPEGTPFVTLDGKERKLSSEDLMICSQTDPMCIAGVFGGLNSGIKTTTKNIFLESAYFNPTDIRKTSVRHGLRTEAASHFEKGTDISNTVNALQRAVALIKEYCHGQPASAIMDVFPHPQQRRTITLKYAYLKKLSGKDYSSPAVKKILKSLGFDILGTADDELVVAAPHHKPDISLPADVVEEIMRIDGLDNIAIPSSITISPSTDTGLHKAFYKEKVSSYLASAGFHEILTNSITNSAYLNEGELATSVKMINNLSAELNVMRPSMLQSGLESLSYNLNRKQSSIRLFEFGKTYGTSGIGKYFERDHLCLYLTGAEGSESWKSKSTPVDVYYIKGICQNIFGLLNAENSEFIPSEQHERLSPALWSKVAGETVLYIGMVKQAVLQEFGIKQPVFIADFYWDRLLNSLGSPVIEFKELPKQLPVFRDLAVVVNKYLPYHDVEKLIKNLHLDKLRSITLFDIFESEKLGVDKKSFALSIVFLDEEKTLTDDAVEEMMKKIMLTLENNLKAEIRK
jgi:phenylalanyl-tRNA synthetase beta chain